MNIIIPIGGVGKRFTEEDYNLPKPLIKSLGSPIIFWTIDNLELSSNDKLFIVYREEFNIFNFENLLKNKFRDINFKFIPLKNDTIGASETVLYALEEMNDDELNKLTIVIDSDNFYDENIIKISKEKNNNLIFYHKDYDINPIYSYISIDGNKVVDIREKEKISDNACVGAYCFKTAILLKKTIKLNIIQSKRQKNEFYISSIYNTLIQNDIFIDSVEIKGFNCLGTPKQLKSFSSNLNSSNTKYRFCFDLDNTLVTYPEIEGDYTSVKPIKRTINFLKFLKTNGHTIIIHTARRMRTHAGNLGKVQSDIAKITFDTLDKYKIPFDEIYFGKPYAHFYIDDLSVKPFDDLEKETGFYNIHPEPRDHNKIEIFDDYLIKYSKSIDGEKYYYNNIPTDLKYLFPEILDSGDNFIKLSKVTGIPLSFLNTNNTITEELLFNVFDKINTLHNYSVNSQNQYVDIYLNYYKKVKERVDSFDFSKYENFDSIKNEIYNFLLKYESDSRGKFGVIHGDPVFTNIIIDNKDNVKFIDMRGKIGDTQTIYGDINYDWAKIYQSIIGYDSILMDVELNQNQIINNKFIFEKYIESKFDKNVLFEIKQITKSLLLSLIPIHDNNKCLKYYDLISKI
jgi:capsule biosynthesis phosphatase